MTHWVGSISFEQRDNWEICKRRSLFGSNTATALGVRAGDELFIWGSQQGWLARCRVTADAHRPRGAEDVPWPEPERYVALIPIEVLDEPARPVVMSGPEIERTVGIGTIQLPRFPRVDAQRAEHLAVLLSDSDRRVRPVARPEATPPVSSPDHPLLRSLDELKVDRQLGRPAPYQHLVLLWAIARAVRGEDRLRPFSVVRDELRSLLAPFAVGESAPDPELPWFALRRSPWWQLSPEPDSPVSRGGRDFVRREDPVAGLSAEVYRLVRDDTRLRQAAIDRLSAPLVGHLALHATLTSLLAAGGATATATHRSAASATVPDAGTADAAAQGQRRAGRHFGELPGVPTGSTWATRAEVAQAGVHRPTQSGISGTKAEGCDSVVVSGGYEDDSDAGDEILYTGAGGNDPVTGKQIADQTLDQPGNAGLVTSQNRGLPVRVVRGAKGHPAYSPTAGYRYDGLYRVADHWSRVGRSGFRVWQFRLQRLSEQDAAPYVPPVNVPNGRQRPATSQGITTRVVRDTKVSRYIKQLYNDACQVCGVRLEVPGGALSEGAHIRALGRPHSGPDVVGNLLCLCPNHHALFDQGGIYVSDDLKVHDHGGAVVGSLTKHAEHLIEVQHLKSHRERWRY